MKTPERIAILNKKTGNAFTRKLQFNVENVNLELLAAKLETYESNYRFEHIFNPRIDIVEYTDSTKKIWYVLQTIHSKHCPENVEDLDFKFL